MVNLIKIYHNNWLDIVKLLKSCVSSDFQHIFTYNDGYNDAFSLVYIQKNDNFADVGNGAMELKFIHSRLFPKLKKLGYEIVRKKIGPTCGYIDYYSNDNIDEVRFPGIRIAASSVPSSNMEGQSVVTIVLEAYGE